MAKQIILDTDPGIDDAVAISMALKSEQLDVKLLVATAGNVGVATTFENLGKLQAFLGTKAPMVKGATRPLLVDPIEAKSVHGVTGMAGYAFPEPDFSSEVSGTAVDAIHDVVAHATDKVTLVGIGPLTNYAMYLRQYPQDVANIAEIVLMGGAIGRGNFGVLSEFNFAADPHSADIVFKSGVPIRVAPLEVGMQAKVMPETSEKIKHMGKVGDMFYQLFSKYRGGSFQTGLKIYDALAMGMLMNPEMFSFESTHVAIETHGQYTMGASLMDFKGYLKQPDNAEIAIQVDVEAFETWFLGTINSLDK
ncbi:ribonucleoside hydrolase RihC [Periweissella cryptocerci]|uniref:Ribonucleoside hydrolase RihC n=1 Tax=Periweissella cryptocerci TaxID=2506420 RepID=A0A4P6YVU0_9LACO|nr:nucleoside hydrolase [Periweissella cryptocerci]QBO36873.1 ribonucleoside hydrolase RihC [Periweissella cryptocerci]